MIDYYKVLGIKNTATIQEIKKAYRELALRFHPDRNPNDEKSESQFKIINEAYSILSNQEKRTIYDKSIIAKEKNKNQQNGPKATPQTFLAYYREIREKINKSKKDQINQKALFENINILLTPLNINFLINYGDTDTNKLIIEEVLTCLKKLDYEYSEELFIKLSQLAGSDNEIILKIFKTNKKEKIKNSWKKNRSWLVVFFLSLFISIYALVHEDPINNTPSNQKSEIKNGDLTEFFKGTDSKSNPKNNSNNNVKELTIEQKQKNEKLRLIGQGWKATNNKNGQMPECYNFKPTTSNIDNYLEVQVGKGTDVVIKLIDKNTNKCIRYVFINSKTTYRIKNIPEGIYYLKIAYGKNWYSKIEDGKCIGRFIENPLYEKGEELLDFNLQHNAEGYNVPSFQLKLDVISSTTENTFNSKNISESEFNN